MAKLSRYRNYYSSQMSLDDLSGINATGASNNDVLICDDNGEWVSRPGINLVGGYDYLEVDGQQITVNQVDLSTDVTGSLPNFGYLNVFGLSGGNAEAPYNPTGMQIINGGDASPII